MSWDFKEIFEPDWRKIALSFVILFLASYLAPCKVTLAGSAGFEGDYWSICGKAVPFPDALDSDATGMQFSFLGVLEISDRMLFGFSFLVLIAYALSYAVSSVLVHYFKGRMS